MEFIGVIGDAKAQDGTDLSNDVNTTHKDKIKNLLANTKWDNTDKFGEGNFALRLTVDNKDIVVELVDKSNFNGGKEYVMDSQTIKGGAKNPGAGQGPHTVTLAGQEIKFTDLNTKFVNALKTPANNKTIKTLDINIKNEVIKHHKVI